MARGEEGERRINLLKYFIGGYYGVYLSTEEWRKYM
jgi:hypothetical protein